jgi:hypothetical protein
VGNLERESMLFDLVNVGKLYKERDGSFVYFFPIFSSNVEPTNKKKEKTKKDQNSKGRT